MTRAEIEVRLRTVTSADFNGKIFVSDAVSVTERLLREQRERWGHAPHCSCCPDFPAEASEASYVIGRNGMRKYHGHCEQPIDQHPIRDPRCAPQHEKGEEHGAMRCCSLCGRPGETHIECVDTRDRKLEAALRCSLCGSTDPKVRHLIDAHQDQTREREPMSCDSSDFHGEER